MRSGSDGRGDSGGSKIWQRRFPLFPGLGYPERMTDAVVIGAGVAGLGAALALARSGAGVTLLERDATPLPEDPDAAFAWDRRGAPQVRHSHALLALLRNILRDRFPDVLDDLLAAGATEMVFLDMMPDDIDDPSPQPGDEDLVALACRRTTFEWVLRRQVLAEPGVRLLDGVAVESLVAEPAPDGRPHVRGVHLADGRTLDADVVVAAGGRRSGAVRWLGEVGIEPKVEEEDTGIIYLSRFYRLREGSVPPRQEGPIGGDLGYLKYAVFQGDNGTFSVTFAVRSRDDEMRSMLLDPDRFDVAARTLTATAPWVEPGLADAITEVHVMGGLLNRHIQYLDSDGSPLVLGFHAVGDAHTCTNPLYGRGCSLGLLQAVLLTDALAEHPGDDVAALDARSRAYEAASADRVEPWYRAAVQQDRMGRAAAAKEREAPEAADGAPGATGNGTDDADPATFMRDLLVHGVLPALRQHAVVLRAFIRMFNLLTPPESLMNDPEVLARVMEAYQDRDQREPDAPLGPPRAEMLRVLTPA